MTNFIGLDLSTSCSGFAAVGEDLSLIYYQEIKPKSSWGMADRCNFIAEEIVDNLAYYTDFCIWAEAIGTRFIQSAMGMGRVHQAVADALVRTGLVETTRSLAYSTVAPSVVKKFATGKGNAKKQDMINAAVGRWPGNKFTDNEADAALVALYGAHIVLGEKYA